MWPNLRSDHCKSQKKTPEVAPSFTPWRDRIKGVAGPSPTLQEPPLINEKMMVKYLAA